MSSCVGTQESGRKFSRHEGLFVRCLLYSCNEKSSARDILLSLALPASARMSPSPGYPSAGLHFCRARFRFTWSRCSARLSGSFLYLQGQTVLAVVLEDEPLLGSLSDSQLCCALGTFCALHDFFAQLVVAQLSTAARQRLADVGRFHFAAWCGLGRHRTGAREPQGLRIQFQKTRRLGRCVAELKAQGRVASI